MRRELAALAAFVLPATLAQAAHAGGLARPNVVGSRAIGWGGAYTAVADDPTALHFNPAGMALQLDDTVLVGAEGIVAPRSYKPLDADGNLGPAQSPSNAPAFLPVLGYVTRLHQDRVPSRWALGIGLWSTYGGALDYGAPDPKVKAINSTTIGLIEVVPGIAYEVNDFLQLGAAFRLGYGIFSVNATRHTAAQVEASSTGLGTGFTLGAMVSPTETLRLGLVWRSPINIDTKGSADIDVGGTGTIQHVDASLEQNWPQQASIAAHWQVSPALALALQADWTDWSAMQGLTVVAGPVSDTNQTDFEDSYAAHIGAQYTLSDALALRGGYTLDGNAVPDRTIDRTFLDQRKHCVAVGLGWEMREWVTFDVALESVFGPVRHVPDNSADYAGPGGFGSRANVAPGDHEGQIYSLELAAQFHY
jgi:long-chain fatty acid transport protein